MVLFPVCQRQACKLSRLVDVWQYDYRIVVLEFDPASCLWHYLVMPLCSINQHSEKDALELSTFLVKEHRIGSKKVSDFQAIQHKLAVMATEIEATKWLDYCGARWIDQGPLETETASKVKLIAS